MSGWFGAWGAFRSELHEAIDLGDRGVVLANVVGRGSGSGGVVDQPFAVVFDLEDGRVIRHQDYSDPAEALEAVGLRE